MIKALKTLIKFDVWLHRINVGRIIAYHCRGYTKVKIISINGDNYITYFEGKLITLRELKWKDKNKLYRERVYRIEAAEDTLIVQILNKKPELAEFIQNKIKELNVEEQI